LDDFGEKTENNIEQDVLDNINKEYQSFLGRKLSITRIIKDFNDKMSVELNSLTLPSLDTWLPSMLLPLHMKTLVNIATNKLESVYLNIIGIVRRKRN